MTYDPNEEFGGAAAQELVAASFPPKARWNYSRGAYNVRSLSLSLWVVMGQKKSVPKPKETVEARPDEQPEQKATSPPETGTTTAEIPSQKPSGTTTDQTPSEEPTDQTPSDEPSGTTTEEPSGTTTDQTPSDEPSGTTTDQTPSEEPSGTTAEPSGTTSDQTPSDEPSITVQPPTEEPGEPRREQSQEKSVSPPPPKPLQHLQIEGAHHHGGSTESIIGLIHPHHLNPTEHKDPVKFKDIQPTIRTGDLALLYRHDQPFPHLAIFINHVKADPLFPLLLVKGKTKPLSLSKFDPEKPRFIHPVTATTRIFYGDYEKVAIQYVKREEGLDVEIDPVMAMNAVHEVEKIEFTKKEQEMIKSADTDQDRSLYMSTFMAAYYYKILGIFKGNPEDVTPENIRDQLPLMDPIPVFLPPVKVGPMWRRDPPFLKQLV